MANFSFTPDTLTILQGDTVEWNNTDGFHNVHHTCEPSLFGNTPADAPWTYQFVFSIPLGAYPYICEIHPDMMRGLIKVQRRARWDVTVRSFSFTPQNLTITTGDTVVWTNVSGFHNVHHNATPALFGNSAASAPWVYSFVFNLPDGAYPYICQVHPALMSGTVAVLSPAPVSAPGAMTIFPENDQVYLTWQSVCGATSYTVMRGNNVSESVFPNIVATTSDTTLTDSIAAIAGAPVFYMVRASND